MITIWNVFGKDARRFWPLLLAWFGVLGLSMFAGVSDPFPRGRADRGGLDMIDLPRWLLFGAVVIAFFQEDRFAGSREFWMTRPFSPLRLLAAKVLSLVVWLVLPSGLALFYVARALGVERSFAFEMGLNACGLALLPISVLSVVASMTRSFLHTVLVVAGIWGMGYLGSLYGYEMEKCSFLYAPMTWHNRVATNYAIVLCHCICSLGLLVFQAVTRKTKITVSAGVLIFAFVWNASAVFPSLDRVGRASVALTPPDEIQVGDLTPLIRRIDIDRWDAWPMVAVGFDFKNVPKDRLFEVSETKSDFDALNRHYRWKRGSGSEFIYSPNGGKPQEHVTIAAPSAADYRLLSKNRGTLVSHWVINEREIRTTEIPFRGARQIIEGRGIVLRLKNVMNARDGSAVATAEFEAVYVNWWKREFELYLVNRSTNERTKSVRIHFAGSPFALIERIPRWTLTLIEDTSEAEGSKGVEKEQRVFPIEWIKSANVVLVEEDWIGAVEKTISIKDFAIPW